MNCEAAPKRLNAGTRGSEVGPPRRGGQLRASAKRAHLDLGTPPVFDSGRATCTLARARQARAAWVSWVALGGGTRRRLSG